MVDAVSPQLFEPVGFGKLVGNPGRQNDLPTRNGFVAVERARKAVFVFRDGRHASVPELAAVVGDLLPTEPSEFSWCDPVPGEIAVYFGRGTVARVAVVADEDAPQRATQLEGGAQPRRAPADDEYVVLRLGSVDVGLG